jgi:hypothetical protein
LKPTTCPIWGTPAEELPKTGDRREIVSPRAGGRYAISGTVEATLEHHPLDDRERQLLTDWIVGQRREGKKSSFISSYALTEVIGRGG